jgi:glycosyltransferase involved in cell wall biosynthesis
MVTPRFPPYVGGVETHVREVATRLAHLGVEVEVLTTDPDGLLPRRDAVDGIRVRRVPAYPAGRDYHLAPGIFSAIRRDHHDVVHVQGIHTAVAPIAMFAAVIGGRPFVVTFHTGGHRSSVRNRLRGLQWRLLTPLLRRAFALVAVSEFERTMIAKAARIDPGRIRVIRNGGTLPRQDEPVAEDPDLVISVGRLERYKGHHRAVAALPLLQQQRPGARLLILGDGPDRESLHELARQLDVSESVTVRSIPATERDEMARALGSARLVVLLSEYEAHPVAVTEARALGRRVLVADTTGLTEMVASGQAAAVAVDASPDELAARMHEVMTDEAPEMGDQPSWEACADQLLAIYRAAGSSKHARSATRQPRSPATP